MKNNSMVGAMVALIALSFYDIAAMPPAAVDTPSTDLTAASALEKRVAKSLARLNGMSSLSGQLDVLNLTLDNVDEQPVSSQTQSSYCNAVRTLDIYARRFASPGRTPSISKKEIAALSKLLKNLQDSPLLYAGFAAYISSAVSFWDKTAQQYGLSKYQRALQQKKRSKSKKS